MALSDGDQARPTVEWNLRLHGSTEPEDGGSGVVTVGKRVNTYCMHLARCKLVVFLAFRPSIVRPVAPSFFRQNTEKIEMVKKERLAVIQFLAQRESGLPALAKVAQATHATHIPIGA